MSFNLPGTRLHCITLRQPGNFNITIQRRPPIGPLRPTRFIRRRSTAFLLTLFTTLVGCKDRQLRPCRHPRSTRPRLRGVRRWSRVLFQTRFLLQTAQVVTPRRAEGWLWAQRRTRQVPDWISLALDQQPRKLPSLLRTSRRRRQAPNLNSRSRDCLQVAMIQRPPPRLLNHRRHRLFPKNKMIGRLPRKRALRQVP